MQPKSYYIKTALDMEARAAKCEEIGNAHRAELLRNRAKELRAVAETAPAD